MARKATELGPLAVSRLIEPGFYFVGGVAGLALQVNSPSARSWVLRAMIAGKRRDMGLGGFPDVTLAGARDAARSARAKIKAGIDPIDEAKAAKSIPPNLCQPAIKHPHKTRFSNHEQQKAPGWRPASA